MDKRRNVRKLKTVHQLLKISAPERSGASTPVPARLLDSGDGGIGIEVPKALPAGSWVTVTGEIGEGAAQHSLKAARARVSWCTTGSNGSFRVGLTFENPSAVGPEGEPSQADHYDTLQVSTKADPDTIHRVYRILAQRYHPDNPETGNEEMFRQLSEAYRVLGDPERRAAYDIRNRLNREIRWKIFDQATASRGMEAEKRKRQGILTLLYTKRMNEPHQPALGLHDLEEMLGCPREHLEFSLWFLKENALVARGDNGRYSITARGAERAEENDIGWLRQDRLLTAATAQPPES